MPTYDRPVPPWIALLAPLSILLILLLLFGPKPSGLSVDSGGNGGTGASDIAIADIPAQYLQLYKAAGDQYGVDWAILAAIGKIETDHGRSTAAGVRSGVNFAGCCAGPMQFSINPRPSTWDMYGKGGNVYDPADAIPAAARYLVAAGAPKDYHQAILAYNHAEWYYQDVMAKAKEYRGAAKAGVPIEASAEAVLAESKIHMTPIQRGDVRQNLIDKRILATMMWIAQNHWFVVTALKSDHSHDTVSGNTSNHFYGRAMDIGAVDGEICRGTQQGRCADLGRELAAVTGTMRSTELIYCFDLDGPNDPRGFARSDHCDHLHVGFDG